MNLTRNSLRKSEEKVKKDPAAFIEGAESVQKPETAKVGRPKSKKELTKPVSISLTDTSKGKLEDQALRFQMLSRKRAGETVKLNRSDVVRKMADYLDSLDDDDFYELISSIED